MSSVSTVSRAPFAWGQAAFITAVAVLVFVASLVVGFYIAFWDLFFTEILKLINPA